MGFYYFPQGRVGAPVKRNRVRVRARCTLNGLFNIEDGEYL
jgi:hypothetical protein